MRKKILIAEKSDAVRSIAESILHQNGFDVISASTIDKAKEYIIAGDPSMLIIGADMQDDDGRFLYDIIAEAPNTASLPLLLIAGAENISLPYPPEVILPRPFDPQDFIDKVKLFVGVGDEKPQEKISTAEPTTSDPIAEDFLDSALGVDRIEVEESEVLDKTHISQKIRQIMSEKKKDIYDIHHDENGAKNELEDTGGRVESLMIRDDSPDEKKKKEKEIENSSSQSKLEIQDDQYGLLNQIEDDEISSSQRAVRPKKDHDYDWFINEMQKDTTGPAKPTKETHPPDSKLETRPTSDGIEPILPDSVKEENVPAEPDTRKDPEIIPGGVDKFISDFKKEIEQLNQSSGEAAVPEQTIPESAADNLSKGPDKASAEPKVPLDPDEMHHFVTHMVEMLAEKLAKKIIDKIDKNEVHRMLQDELNEYLMQKNIS